MSKYNKKEEALIASIKPCPVCGSKARFIKKGNSYAQVKCIVCKFSTIPYQFHDYFGTVYAEERTNTIELAIKVWNSLDPENPNHQFNFIRGNK
jgi:hypothetical protein